MLELTGNFLKNKHFPSFFEHNMRFLYYSDALCIQINRFEIKGQTLNVSFFSTFCEFQIKTYFSSQYSKQ